MTEKKANEKGKQKEKVTRVIRKKCKNRETIIEMKREEKEIRKY